VLIDGDVLVSGDAGRQFRAQFEVLHDFGSFNSYCDLTLSNLRYTTVASALKRGGKLTLRCGYVDNIDVIFSGTIQNTFNHRSGTEINTQIIARGSGTPDTRPIVNKSFGAGVSVVELIRACADAMDIPAIIIESQFSDVPGYVGGYRMTGDPLQFLNALSLSHSFSFTIENGRLLVVRKGQSRAGSVEQISQFTGMEGSPEITEVGATVTTRLNPRARVGDRFQINSQFATFNYSNVFFQNVPDSAGLGIYTTTRLSHSGDSHGDIWSTRREGVRPV